MQVKRYSKQEPMVFLWVVVPYILAMNLLIFGSCIFNSVPIFLKSFAASVIYFSLIYGVFGSVAVLIKNKNPGAGDLFRRIRIMLPVFYLMNIGAIYGAYFFYDYTGIIGCPSRPNMIWWTILYGCLMSTVITFINEGMANWEKWKNSLSESEKLNNAYQRSKLLGLKGQINPHFLFNCFNTLSGLIEENEEEAEQFLDEMTKVHRYLLRGDDEYLVPLLDEMKFASSYLYLTKARFGNAINIIVDLPKELLLQCIPPLSMQVILENIIYANALSKKEPLTIRITHQGNKRLIITHSIHEKTIVQHLNIDEGLDNLITKYRLLNSEEIQITETPEKRVIVMPLFEPITKSA
jgi:two-component system, LytTR family, sensor kinase